MLEIIDPICFWKNSICMIFGCGDWPIQLSSLFAKTAPKETEDVGPGAAIFQRILFCLIRDFFSPNFENLPEQAILPKLDLSHLTMDYSRKKKQGGWVGRGVEPSNTPLEFLVSFTPRNSTKFCYHTPWRF